MLEWRHVMVIPLYNKNHGIPEVVMTQEAEASRHAVTYKRHARTIS